MSRTANVINNGEVKPTIHVLQAQISVPFNEHIEAWVRQNDITRSSAIRVYCADGFGYKGVGDELALVKQSEARKHAGDARSASMKVTKHKAGIVDALKVKLATGEDLSKEDLMSMLMAALG